VAWIDSIRAKWRSSPSAHRSAPTKTLDGADIVKDGRLLRRYGFEVRLCKYVGMYRSLDTMAYIVLSIKHNRPVLYRFLKSTHLLGWGLYLNLRDIMYVVAERA
jgi:hypothetical protein